MEPVTCCVCAGSGKLLRTSCPLCEGDPSFFNDPVEQRAPEPVVTERKVTAFEINLNGAWMRFDRDTERAIVEASEEGDTEVRIFARGFPYIINLKSMVQINAVTRAARQIRKVEKVEKIETPVKVCRSPRQQKLIDKLLSPSVQVPLPAQASEEEAKLDAAGVRKVFIDHVPGVEKFLYREMHGNYCLKFMVSAYFDGLRAFKATEMHNHLLWLYRRVIHHGHAGGKGAAAHLREVAEAFMDCQAVQARVVEKIGLELLGVQHDFRGMVVQLLGDYKGMALKMLAQDRLREGRACDDGNPTHYENRLTADVGPHVGLDADDIRRARLDEHAEQRFSRLRKADQAAAAARCRELFDLEAWLTTLKHQLNSFGEASAQESLPSRFLQWSSTRLREAHKHIVFDAETCTKVAVEDKFVVAMVEVLFLGEPAASDDETYRDCKLKDLFLPPTEEEANPAARSKKKRAARR
eukprot:TRINITY_DN8707_c0_g1_i6.p1 TRINITY_DN8707_c0_g1~~TRINITY_DN8707_c0_g1_i6.p1  ORF type:complete len:467 (+),score=131.77 TRINITY_DN8707_c0_g1_i6:72-1472(+)